MAQELTREEILTRVVCAILSNPTPWNNELTVVDYADGITGEIVDKIATYVTKDESDLIDELMARKNNSNFEEEQVDEYEADEIDDEEMPQPPQRRLPRIK